MAEDILLSKISSTEGSIVDVRKLITCEAVLFSADDGLYVVVMTPTFEFVILCADEGIWNYEI